jgi:rieske iron-sulfur protein
MTQTAFRGRTVLSKPEKKSDVELNRRQLLGCMCALGFSLPGMAEAQTADPATNSPPQVNDLVAYAYGDKAGQPVSINDLDQETKQIFAFALDPATKQMRNGSRMNQLLLIRLDPARLSPETAARSVNGLVAYSGVCSHTGCDVTDWNGEMKRFQCPCHESQFDPADSARVVGGPAPWQLAALPLKEIDGQLAVAGEFEGRLGFQQPGLSPFGI